MKQGNQNHVILQEGHSMGKFIDLTGQRFGRLIVLERGENSNDGNAKWICGCDCGSKRITVFARHLRSGHTKSWVS